MLLASSNASYATGKEVKLLSKQLEASLNNRNTSKWNELMTKDISATFTKQYQKFIERFPNAQWSIKSKSKGHGNQDLLNLYITAYKEIGGRNYSLKAEQSISITHQDLKIIKKEILSEFSILNNTKNPLDVTLNIPNTVLTGSQYDIDIILEKPLEDSIIAGDIVPINSINDNNYSNPSMQLAPMGAGGLFKTTQAPLQPGKQRWAALIAHPEGLVSITKMVRVVSSKDELSN